MTGAALLLASRVASALIKLGGPGSDMMRGTDGRDYLNQRGETITGNHSNDRGVMRRTFILLASLRANIGLGKASALAILTPITIVTASLLAASVAGTVNAQPTCQGSLQALVNAADPGTVVETAAGCVYREQVTINKPLTLRRLMCNSSQRRRSPDRMLHQTLSKGWCRHGSGLLLSLIVRPNRGLVEA
jgi:hypothetical protein